MILIVSTLIVGLVDFSLKYYLVATSSPHYTLNEGVAFGIGHEWLSGIGLLLAISLAFLTKLIPRIEWIALIIAVAGNLIDRIFHHGIVDYLVIGPLHFNLTDVLICGLVVRIGWHLLQTKDAAKAAS